MSITIRSDFDVEVVDVAGSDQMICRAARVSTLGASSIDSLESAGLINFLMKNRHGSPFEHAMMTFRISAPIAVWREFMRHRIGFSYNEQSGRYMELSPVFYIPIDKRPLKQVGKAGEYRFIGEDGLHEIAHDALEMSYRVSWDAYQAQLAAGVAKEVARMCLPVGLYSTAYVTCNPRSLMAFLSLRTQNELALFPSFPQWEIARVADMMEVYFSRYFPLTHSAFIAARRVSP